MNTLEWRSLGWGGNNQLIEQNRQPIGRLIFNPGWKATAEYNSGQRKTKFASTARFGKSIDVLHDNEIKGKITITLVNRPLLQLKSGKEFELTSGLFGRKLLWRTLSGEQVIKFANATLTSMGRGHIEISKDLSTEEEDILVSGALVIRNFLFQRMSYFFYLFFLITFAERMLSRFLS